MSNIYQDTGIDADTFVHEFNNGEKQNEVILGLMLAREIRDVM